MFAVMQKQFVGAPGRKLPWVCSRVTNVSVTEKATFVGVRVTIEKLNV